MGYRPKIIEIIESFFTYLQVVDSCNDANLFKFLIYEQYLTYKCKPLYDKVVYKCL